MPLQPCVYKIDLCFWPCWSMRCGDRYIARTMRQPLNRSLACRHVVCGCSTSRIEAVCRHSTQKEYVSIIIVLETGFPLWPPQSSSARGLRQPLASTYSLRDLNFTCFFLFVFTVCAFSFFFSKQRSPNGQNYAAVSFRDEMV